MTKTPSHARRPSIARSPPLEAKCSMTVMVMVVVMMVMVMVMVDIQSCVFVRAGIEESDDYVLSSANISETHAVDSMRPSIACSVAPPCVLL